MSCCWMSDALSWRIIARIEDPVVIEKILTHLDSKDPCTATACLQRSPSCLWLEKSPLALMYEIAREALGGAAEDHLDYFGLCRRKRKKVDYDLSGVATDRDVEEQIRKAMAFKTKFGLS